MTKLDYEKMVKILERQLKKEQKELEVAERSQSVMGDYRRGRVDGLEYAVERLGGRIH